MEVKNSPVKNFYLNVEAEKAKIRLANIDNGVRRGRPRKNKMYFTATTEEAIVAYNKEESLILKEKVYNGYIHEPLFKLAENIINRFRFYYMDGTPTDVKYEVIAFLLEKLPKYTQDKGKAFSYFSIVAKNYLIQNNNKAYKKMISKASLDLVDFKRNITNEVIRADRTESLNDFMTKFIIHYDILVEKKFRGDRDRRIAYAILQIFKSRHNIENYNKKALYIMIREITGTKTQYITKVVNEIKKEYVRLYDMYEKDRLVL